MRYKGAVISATPPTTSISAATGSWALQSMMQSVAAGTWPRVPSEPTIDTATAASSSTATVTFTPPTDLGAGAITYTATSFPGSITGTGTSPITVSGLTFNTTYTFTVSGATPGGTGPASAASNSVTTFPPNWIATLGDASTNYGLGVAVDSSGNVYVVGRSQVSSIDDIQLAKYNNAGAIQWQRSLGGTGYQIGQAIVVDAASNVYVAGFYSSAPYDMMLAKYDTSGAIQFQKLISQTSGTGSQIANDIVLDSSGNIYLCGNEDNQYIQTVKLDSTGTVLWDKRLGKSSGQNYGQGIAIDASGNLFVVGYTGDTSPANLVILKYNNSGVLQWQRILGDSISTTGSKVCVDSSGNLYVVGVSILSPFGSVIIVKYDTSGTLQWQRTVTDPWGNTGYDITIDTDNNLYVVGIGTYATSNQTFLILKYNSSGTIQWQRSLKSNSSTRNEGYGITVDTSGNFYITGRVGESGAEDFVIAKLPTDGSKTGTYTVGGVNFVYAVTSFTASTSTLVGAIATLTAPTPTPMTSTTSTFTDAATSLTSSVTTL